MVTPDTVSVRKTRRLQRVHARAMRRNPSEAERKFWWLVRGRRLAGYKFKRQFLIGPYIADFACLEAKLAVELDGGQHQNQTDYDENRTMFLQRQGWQVLRFWNNDVLNQLDGVLSMVVSTLTTLPPS